MIQNSKYLMAILACAVGLTATNAQAESICIDPGHGGPDPGATGCNLVESEINLSVSMKLKTLLEAAGYTVYMTRTDEPAEKLELAARTEYANSKGVTTFASIHTNSATAEATGIETYCYTGCLTKKGNNYQQATNIQNEMLEAWPLNSRKVKEAGYYVIKNTSMPATLTELAFINNCEKDAIYLGSDEHRQEAAQAHCEAIVAKWGGDATKCSGGSTPTPTQTGKVYAGTYASTISNDTWLGGVSYTIGSETKTSAETKSMLVFEVPVGKYTATASKEGYITTTRTDCAEATTDSPVYCSIALPVQGTSTKGTATGVVKDGKSGSNIAATVAVEGGSSANYDGQNDWSFELEAGTYSISASAKGYEDGSVSCIVTPDQSVSCPITLVPQKGTIAGTVTDSETKAAIAATVSLGSQSAKTGSDGAWAFSVEEGNYTINASADGYDVTSVSCSAKKGESTKCDIAMTKSSTKKGFLKGTLKDADSGALIAGEVSTGDGAIYHYNGQDKWQFYLEPGAYDVTGSADGYVSSTKKCTVEAEKIVDCDIALEASAAKVSGNVFNGVNWSLVAATVSAGGKSVQYSGEGDWTLELKPGEYEFTATDGAWTGTTKCSVEAGRNNICNIAILNPNAETGSLSGTVYDASNQNLKLKSRVKIEGYIPADYNGSGTWQIDKLPVGRHNVTATADGYFENTVSCTVVSSDNGIEHCAIPLKIRTATEVDIPDEGDSDPIVDPPVDPVIDSVDPEIRYESNDSCSATPKSGHSGAPVAVLLGLLALVGIRRRQHKGVER